MNGTTKQLALLVGTNIRSERMRQDLSREAFAERAKITSQYLSLLENGDRCGSMAVYLEIANALRLDICYLFANERSNGTDPDSIQSALQILSVATPLGQRVMIAALVAIRDALRSDS
jgi:Predicted transcriptional regulators